MKGILVNFINIILSLLQRIRIALSYQRDLLRIISCKKTKKAENFSEIIAAKQPEFHKIQMALCVLNKIRN